MVSDTSFAELHAFARQIGIPRVAFQGDHYDLHETRRALAVGDGATEVSARDIVRALSKSGLRRGPALSRGGLDAVATLSAPELLTERLRLRQWRPDDLPRMHEINSDAAYMRFSGARTIEQTKKSIDRDAVGLALRGAGKFAVERRDTGAFVGRVGLGLVADDHPFGPAAEIGWYIRHGDQGQGFATEAAAAVLRYAHEDLDLDEVVSFTAMQNLPSQRVMERLAMTRNPADDFDHPYRSADDPLRHYVLYRWSPKTAQ